MKQRAGAVLCLVIGAALLWGGIFSISTAQGSVASTCTPNPSGGVKNQCPTGIITFSETTTGPGGAPSQWTLTVSSSCTDPATGQATRQTLHVPNNGSISTTALPVYTNSSATTLCAYQFKETAAPRFTKSFSPSSPATISFDGTLTGSSLAVAISNVSSGSSSGSTSPTTPTTTPVTTPVTTPNSSSASPSSTSRTSASTTPNSSDAGPTTIAQTGPSSSVGPTIIVGVLLCLLGVAALVFARRRPAARQH